MSRKESTQVVCMRDRSIPAVACGLSLGAVTAPGTRGLARITQSGPVGIMPAGLLISERTEEWPFKKRKVDG